MAEQLNLKEFMHLVLAIKPPYGDIVQNGIPGMGMSNIAADKTNELYKTARDFAIGYQDVRVNEEELHVLASNVEGVLATLTVLGVVDSKMSDELIEKLYALAIRPPKNQQA